MEGILGEGSRARLRAGQLVNREETVTQIHSMLQRKGVVQLYAPPQSGKTTTCALVCKAAKQNPQVYNPEHVHYVNLARVEPNSPEHTFEKIFEEKVGKSFVKAARSPQSSGASVDPLAESLEANLDSVRSVLQACAINLEGAPRNMPDISQPETAVPDLSRSADDRITLIVLDEVQNIYDIEGTKSHRLWKFLKDIINGDSGQNVCFFLSGSRGPSPIGDAKHCTPIELSVDAIITLWPKGDNHPGQNFTPHEFDDALCSLLQPLGFTPDQLPTLKFVLETMTGNHIGAFYILGDELVKLSPENFQQRPARWEKRVLERFLFTNKPLQLADGRGFPRQEELASAPEDKKRLCQFFIERTGYVDMDDIRHADQKERTNVYDALRAFIFWGYAFLEDGNKACLASSLHLEHIRFAMGQRTYTAEQLPDSAYLLLRDGFSKCSANHLQAFYTRGEDGRVLEEGFQYELYTAFISLLPPSQSISTSVGSAFHLDAKLDILVMPLGLGIEILRDDSNIKEHAERWEPGSADKAPGRYYQLRRDGIVKDFATIDIRNPEAPTISKRREDVTYCRFTEKYKSVIFHLDVIVKKSSFRGDFCYCCLRVLNVQ